MLGFRLRSPLLERGTVPAPPSNGFLIHKPSQDLGTNFAGAKVACFRNPLACAFSNMLGGRFHRLPSVKGSGRLNLQGHFFHSRVFCPHYLEENNLRKCLEQWVERF